MMVRHSHFLFFHESLYFPYVFVSITIGFMKDQGATPEESPAQQEVILINDGSDDLTSAEINERNAKLFGLRCQDNDDDDIITYN